MVRLLSIFSFVMTVAFLFTISQTRAQKSTNPIYLLEKDSYYYDHLITAGPGEICIVRAADKKEPAIEIYNEEFRLLWRESLSEYIPKIKMRFRSLNFDNDFLYLRNTLFYHINERSGLIKKREKKFIPFCNFIPSMK